MVPTINQNTKQHVNPAGKKVVSIAMQGGGAHGAFSWGVLDIKFSWLQLTSIPEKSKSSAIKMLMLIL